MSAEALITTPFGFDSTAADVIAGIDLTGKPAIVTGGSSGIGVETARALAGAGAEVTLAVRNPVAGAETAADIWAYYYKTAEHRAATSVLVATWPQLEGIGGRYFQDCREAPVVDAAAAETAGAGVAVYAVDPINSERLWELSRATLA